MVRSMDCTALDSLLGELPLVPVSGGDREALDQAVGKDVLPAVMAAGWEVRCERHDGAATWVLKPGQSDHFRLEIKQAPDVMKALLGGEWKTMWRVRLVLPARDIAVMVPRSAVRSVVVGYLGELRTTAAQYG